jgi:hypothetical protein
MVSIVLSVRLTHPAGSQNQFQQLLDTVSAERMLADVISLSSPEFNGRQTGTEDDFRSAQFVARRFSSLGLLLSGAPFDRFNFIDEIPTGFMTKPAAATVVGPEVSLQLSTTAEGPPARLGSDFLPILDSPSADLYAPIVFAGYGISDPAQGFDEYANLDVANSIVLFLRGKPDHYPKAMSHAEKERIARKKSAVAYLTVTGPVLNAYEARRGITGKPSAFYGQTEDAQVLPGAWINTELAEHILARGDERQRGRLRDLQEQLNRIPTPQSIKTPMYGRLQWESRKQPGFLVNVLASIPGSDPVLRAETVIVGAHRDHFGKQAGLLFAGADDNASGTSVMLEVARSLKQPGLSHKRTILFISFSGEEQGLLGSRMYIERAVVPLGSTKAMINVDHAGAGNGRLTVGVTGIEKSVAAEAGKTAGIAEKIDLFGFFPGGDHVPFKEAGVPTITVVSGGIHPHFHQPTDTAEKVNPDILQTTARYMLAITWRLANAE